MPRISLYAFSAASAGASLAVVVVVVAAASFSAAASEEGDGDGLVSLVGCIFPRALTYSYPPAVGLSTAASAPSSPGVVVVVVDDDDDVHRRCRSLAPIDRFHRPPKRNLASSHSSAPRDVSRPHARAPLAARHRSIDLGARALHAARAPARSNRRAPPDDIVRAGVNGAPLELDAPIAIFRPRFSPGDSRGWRRIPPRARGPRRVSNRARTCRPRSRSRRRRRARSRRRPPRPEGL